MAEGILGLLMPVAIIVALGTIYILIKLVALWLRTRASRAPVPVARIVRMAMLRINPRAVVDAYAIAVTAGVDGSLDEFENHAMMGGRLQRTVVACAAAKKADVDLPFTMARTMDLTGRDPMEVAQDLIRAKREGDRDAAAAVAATIARDMIGKEGEVSVAVSPPGLVVVNGQRVDAICSTGYIKKNAKVRITAAKDNMVIVEPIAENVERTNH